MPDRPELRYIQGIKCYAPDRAHEGRDFPLAEYRHLVALQERNFWYRSRNRIIAHILRKFLGDRARPKVLEIGCGTGYVLGGLAAEDRYDLGGADLHIEGLVLARARLPAVELVQLDAGDLPYRSDLDAVGAFDVLEHVEDDDAVIGSVHRVLVPGGLFVITVPQHRWLWSPTDDHVRHKRRYSRQDLITKLERQGFAVAFRSSFVFCLLPALYLSRLGKRHGRKTMADAEAVCHELALPKPIDAVLEGVMRLDELLIRAGVSLPVGGSLVAVARKRGG
jgi:SAM-dependent methyltransferase